MRSKQTLVRCGLLAVLVMSASASAAPSPGQLWPSLAGDLASLQVTQVSRVATPELVCWAVDWYGFLWLWVSCPTPGATMHYTLDGSSPTYYSPVCDGLLILAGTGTVKVWALAPNMYPSKLLVLYIH